MDFVFKPKNCLIPYSRNQARNCSAISMGASAPVSRLNLTAWIPSSRATDVFLHQKILAGRSVAVYTSSIGTLFSRREVETLSCSVALLRCNCVITKCCSLHAKVNTFLQSTYIILSMYCDTSVCRLHFSSIQALWILAAVADVWAL